MIRVLLIMGKLGHGSVVCLGPIGLANGLHVFLYE